MDPEATLKALRSAVVEALKITDEACSDPMGYSDYQMRVMLSLGEVLSQGFDDLDVWLSKGGALPKDWSR